MRLRFWIQALMFVFGVVLFSEGRRVSAAEAQQLEITADKSLEWYQEQNLYVARGNAKAVQGGLSVSADLLTAHKRVESGKAQSKTDKGVGSSDIDRMTAEGNVVILNGSGKISGDRAVNDVDQNVVVVTGNDLRYESGDQIVTAKESMEYWQDKKLAVARGNAIAVKGENHIAGDILTAEFKAQPDGKDELNTITATGQVTVLTKNDTVRGDKGVYDAPRDTAVITGNVHIARGDGTELSGDVGEVNFTTNQSRVLNEGSGRVRALLPSKSTPKTGGKKP